LRNGFQSVAFLACALVALLSLSGCAEKEAPKAPLTPAQLRGERLYVADCAVCHRADSEASLNGPGLKGMYRKKFLSTGLPANDERVEEIIRRGRRSMPGYGNRYSDEQVADMIAYLHSL
jgi:mono/diheme cytochrome c family protein